MKNKTEDIYSEKIERQLRKMPSYLLMTDESRQSMIESIRIIISK